MPAWNATPFVEPVLRAYAAQSYPNLEVLISVDRSSDHTADLCERFATSQTNFRVIRQPRRLGWIGNINFLLREARGDYLFFAFHDDTPDANYVARLVNALGCRPDAVLAFSDVRMASGIRVYTQLEGVDDRFERVRRMLYRDGDWFVPNRGLFRIEAAQQLQRMHRHFAGEYMGDWPWLLRLTMLGAFVRVPEPLMHKVWLEQGLSRTWRGNLWQHAGVNASCLLEVLRSDLRPLEKIRLIFGSLAHRARVAWNGRQIGPIQRFLDRYLLWRFKRRRE